MRNSHLGFPWLNVAVIEAGAARNQVGYLRQDRIPLATLPDLRCSRLNTKDKIGFRLPAFLTALFRVGLGDSQEGTGQRRAAASRPLPVWLFPARTSSVQLEHTPF
jgi:hypothetical protein